MSLTPKKKRTLLIILVLLVIIGAIGAWFSWYKFFREEPEQNFASEEERFKYGSIGAEANRGIPYWIWVVLPRVFPDKLPGPGGYKSFGLVWEEGKEMPVGFTKRVIGFPRVANNCAICHTGTWRSKPDEVPHVVTTAPSHTTDIQGLLRFLTEAANDPRFNADTLMGEIDQMTKLSFVDRQIYRYLLIPFTRKALGEQQDQLAWMNRPTQPPWGKGRDDPMNLTKYFMTSMKVDDSTGQADFPSVWNLKVRKGDGLFLNWSCDTPAVRSVIIDSALGLGAQPNNWFLNRMEQVDNFLSEWPAPKYPFHIDEGLAKTGAPIYARLCAECHEPGAARTNRPIPINEIGTDRDRMDTWTQAAADEANRRVKEMGINRPNMVKQEGYQAVPLDGIWMRAPYLHNGSVPTLHDLLEPEAQRPKFFYRGYDVYDQENVGFISNGPEAERYGWKLEVVVDPDHPLNRGNGNQGHRYGTDLPAADKRALLEYLKTL
ncbi:MAG: hypothetical protein V7641_363 [Blastocatellia bacterium]